MVYTEFVSADALIRSVGKTQQKLNISDEERPEMCIRDSVWIDSLTPQFVKKCREHNLQVLARVLGLDDKTEENQKAVDLGVDIIATDHPEKFIMKYGKPSI